MNIVTLVAVYGYAIVAVFVAIEGMGVPVPGELILVTAAAFAAQGHLSLTRVILASSLGTIAGGSGGYWIGRTGGLALVERYGHWVGLNHDKLTRARLYFESHGAKTIVISRFIAILRMVAGILAGVAHMSFWVFAVCNAVGGILWSIAFGLLGYLFGQNLPLLEHYIRRGSLVLLILAAVAAGVMIWRRRHRKAAI